MSQELGNCDTRERRDGASMKAFIVVKHQTCLSVFLFCALLMAYSSWSTALSRWMQFVNVDFCQVTFCVLSQSKDKEYLWVAAMQIHTTKQQWIIKLSMTDWSVALEMLLLVTISDLFLNCTCTCITTAYFHSIFILFQMRSFLICYRNQTNSLHKDLKNEEWSDWWAVKLQEGKKKELTTLNQVLIISHYDHHLNWSTATGLANDPRWAQL